jgi:hypothetical protein
MKCKQIKSNGEQCKMASIPGSYYCWKHSPDISIHEKKAASAKGGKMHRPDITKLDQDLNITSTHDISALLVDTIKNLRNGTFNTRIGTAIGYLAFILVRTYELTEIETKLIDLEKRLDHFDYITITPEKLNENVSQTN